MSTSITSLAELKVEIDKLTVERKIKERNLNVHIKEFAISMRPANLIKNAFTSMSKDTELKSMLKTKGAEAAIGFVVTQLLFKNANPIIRTAATLFGTSFATTIFGDDSSKYIEKIKNIYQKFISRKEPVEDEQFNEGDNYTR